MFEEFKKFAMRGSVVDLAVGVIVGASFTGIVSSLVKDIINPLLGLAHRRGRLFEFLRRAQGRPGRLRRSPKPPRPAP